MFRTSSGFDKLLEKATSHLLLEPDWNVILQLCDCIRQGDVQPKYAINALKKKLYAPNPHVVLYSLQVLESWVKNCGTPIHQEVATKPFMEELKELLKSTTNETVRTKILELVQTWAHAFRNEPNYRAIPDAANLLKVEGYKFPVLKESDAMFAADKAPEWADGECCHRCRVQFTMVQRKHHCRNCGQVFCSKCSSRLSTIPRFGLEKEVRVCEACWEKLGQTKGASTSPVQKSSAPVDGELPSEYVASTLAQQPQAPAVKSEQELQEEEDLQLAIALSKSEAENKEKEKLRATSTILANSATHPPAVSSAPAMESSSLESDPDLARYLNRSYWEQRVSSAPPASTPSAPSAMAPGSPATVITTTPVTAPPTRLNEVGFENGEVDELDEFVSTLRGSLEMFVNRMRSNSSRGRSIAVDTAVQSMFMSITAMHSQLMKHVQDADDRRVYFESLQDKLSQVRDARAALDALREEHHDRLRREAEEAERQRQLQMAHKLELMRKKKQEYLQYQRQIAMQRLQEQEREMQMRQEQQKQIYMRQSQPQPYESYDPSTASPVHAYHPHYQYTQAAQIVPPEHGGQQHHQNMYAVQGMNVIGSPAPPVTTPPQQQQAPQQGPGVHNIGPMGLPPGAVHGHTMQQPPIGPGPVHVQPHLMDAELISFD